MSNVFREASRWSTHRAAADEEKGFSLIEVLISGAILLIVVTGLIPLYTRAMTDNIEGQRSSEVANEARSEVERLMQLNFNHPELTLTSGTELKTIDYWDPVTKRWRDSTSWAPPGGTPDLERQTIIRQYGGDAFTDNVLDPDEALDAATGLVVALKEIEILVTGSPVMRTPGKTVTVRMVRGL